MIFGRIIKQLISCFLLSMLLTQSVFAGIMIPLEVNNNEHSVNNHSIENYCTYDDHHKMSPLLKSLCWGSYLIPVFIFINNIKKI